MRYVLAALGGAAVGATAALLFAPSSGRATRAYLRDKTTKVAGDVQEAVSGKAKHLANKAQGLKHAAADAAAHGGELLRKGQDMLARGQKRLGEIQEAVSHGQDAVDKAKTAFEGSGPAPAM